MIYSSPDSLNGALETSFIRDILFSGKPYNVGLNFLNLKNNYLIYLELFQLNPEFINLLKNNNKKIVLYDMGDEHGKKEKYSYKFCDLVIRNYYFEEFINNKYHPNIMWAPNGYRTGVGPRKISDVKPIFLRNSLSSFLGWINNGQSFGNERHNFAESIKNCQDLIYVLSTRGFAGGYNVGLYSAIMEDSIFSPCPAGNSPETIRLYDSLELGAIPISLRHDFLNSIDALGAIGIPPFPQLDDWNQLPDFLNHMKTVLQSEPEKIQSLQAECLNWWQAYKQHIQEKIAMQISVLH